MPARHVLIMSWGMPQILRFTSKAFSALGYHPTIIFRGLNGGPTWARDAATFIKANRPEYVVSWQRLYGEARPVWQAGKDTGARFVCMDFGVWPHYDTAYYDAEGENRSAAIVGTFDALEADAAQRDATDSMLPIVARMADAMEMSDKEAARAAGKVIPGGLPNEKDFIFLALQRCARGRPDKVLELDAVPSRRDPARIAADVIEECKRQNRYVIIKQHPQGADIATSIPLRGPHHLLMPKFEGKTENNLLFGWCVWNMAHLVTVNSTTWQFAAACGKPTSVLGRGWFSGNGIVEECRLIRDAIPTPETHAERGKRFVAMMLSRQLRHHETKDSRKVRPILRLIHPGRF